MKPGAIGNLRIQATSVPEVWFTNAAFNHAAHRAVDCLACHAGAVTSATMAVGLVITEPAAGLASVTATGPADGSPTWTEVFVVPTLFAASEAGPMLLEPYPAEPSGK